MIVTCDICKDEMDIRDTKIKKTIIDTKIVCNECIEAKGDHGDV